MITYRETQYYHPLFYIVATVVVATAAAMMLALDQALTATLFVSLALIAQLALGRMVTTIQSDLLTVQFGWLGAPKRVIQMDQIHSTRVCMFNPIKTYFGWGWRVGLDGSVCYIARGRRGVEITIRGKRHVIGSQDPRELNAAICGQEPEPLTDERPADATPALLPPRPRAAWTRSMLVPRDWSGNRELV